MARFGNLIGLTYWGRCPYEMGDRVVSPVRDDETRYEFEGQGQVIGIVRTVQELGIVRYELTVRITEGAE